MVLVVSVDDDAGVVCGSGLGRDGHAGTRRLRGAGCAGRHRLSFHALVSINRDGTTTFLFYSLVNLCAQTQLASGFGTVPDAVFTVSNVNLPASAQVRLELTIPPDSATFDSSGDIGAISLTFVPERPLFPLVCQHGTARGFGVDTHHPRQLDRNQRQCDGLSARRDDGGRDGTDGE